MRTDGQTDMMKKLIVAFRNFVKEPKNLQIHLAFDHRQKHLKRKVCFKKFVPKVLALNVNSKWLVHHFNRKIIAEWLNTRTFIPSDQ